MSLFQRCFLVCIFPVVTLTYSPALLDYYHHSRFIVAVFFLTIFSGIAFFQRQQLKEMQLLDFCLLTFTAWSFFSMVWASNIPEALFTTLKSAILLGVYALTTYLMSNVRDQFSQFIHFLSRIVTCIILAFVITEGIEVIRDAGFSNKSLYALNIFFGHKSLIAGYLFLLMPLNLMHLSSEKKGYKLSVALVVLQVIVILLLQSRTVYLALFTMLLLVMIQLVRSVSIHSIKKVRKQVITLTAIGLLGLIFLLQNQDIRQRLNPTTYLTSQTASERRLVWYKTGLLIEDNPWIGVGAGNWKTQFARHSVAGSYRMQDQDVVFTRAHNDFLEVLAELGWPGLFAYLSIFLVALSQLFRGGSDALIRKLLASGIIGFIILSLLDFPRERTEFVVLLGLYLALVSLSSDKKIAKETKNSRLYWVLLFLLNGLGIIAGVARYKAEVNVVRMLESQLRRDWPGVLAASQESKNQFNNLTPAAVPIDFYSGLAYYNLEEKAKALEKFQSAHSIHPYHFHTINNIGTLYVESGNFESALPYFEEAIRINPRFEDAIFNKAFCLSQLNQLTEALKVVHEIPTESPKKQDFIRELTKMMQE